MPLEIMPSSINERAFRWILLAILAFALAERFAVIGHGLPDLQVGDEDSDLSAALRLTQGEIPARTVRYHRSLIAYIDDVAIGGLFGYAYVTGLAHNLQQFQDLYFSDRWMFTLATRIVVATLSVTGILFMALTGRFISREVGLLAAATLALNGFYTLNTLYALPDAIVGTFVALHIWTVFRVWKNRRAVDYFVAGVTLALVMLSKLSAASIGIGLLMAHFGIIWQKTPAPHKVSHLLRALVLSRPAFLTLLGVIVGNIVFNPVAFLHPNDLIWELTRLDNYAYSSAMPNIESQSHLLLDHFTQMVAYVWRWLLPTSMLGVIATWRYRRDMLKWVVVGMFVVLFVTILNVSSSNYKIFYWMPWLIPAVLLSAIGLHYLWHVTVRTRWQIAAYSVTGAVFLLEALFLISILPKLASLDTRQLALGYISDHWQPNTRVLSGEPIAYSIPLQRNETSIRRAQQLSSTDDLKSWDWWLSLPVEKRPGPAYDLYGPEMQSMIDTYNDLHHLIDTEQIDYVVDTEFCQGFTKSPDSNSALDFPPVNGALRQEWELVASFTPFPTDDCLAPIDDRTGLTTPAFLDEQQHPGPIIRIYRIPTAKVHSIQP